MNKKRVMELVTDVANSAYDEAYYHEGSEHTDFLIKDIDEELNSKTVMPKFFDEWAKAYNTYIDDGLDDALKNLFDIYTTGVYEGEIEEKLNAYMQEQNTSERYIKCEKALIDGYEVEND